MWRIFTQVPPPIKEIVRNLLGNHCSLLTLKWFTGQAVRHAPCEDQAQWRNPTFRNCSEGSS